MTTANVVGVTVKKNSPSEVIIQLDVNLSHSFKPMAAFKINTVTQRSSIYRKFLKYHNRTLISHAGIKDYTVWDSFPF